MFPQAATAPSGTGLTAAEREQLHRFYRTLHAHPELSMQEYRTAERIEAELDAMGVERFRCTQSGVVGIVRNGAGPVVALRADTDGLPMLERTGLDYASTVHGTAADGTQVPVMHGCGHDTHIACLIAALRVLLRRREDWSGTLVAVFQPGEELGQGARAMVADGLWERAPRPDVVLGQHVSNQPAGTVTMAIGPAMAGTDSLRVTVHGKQAHGSRPHMGIDPIVLGSAMITRLQTIVSREVDAHEPAVVTVGVFRGGLKENIIPEQAEFVVNVRALTEPLRDQVLAAVRRVVRGEAEVAGAPEPEIEHYSQVPPTINDVQAAEQTYNAIEQTLGTEQVSLERPRMGSEDFGLLGKAAGVPSVLWFFGGAEPGAADPPGNHSPYFAPPLEPTLSTGARAMTAAALHWLKTLSLPLSGGSTD
ncbi:amidohydrolase [Nesterenkonia ebinurensis]|uniref:amidohydrolase n=1 Tax=Nesterenkonia ebinurensis TaxID=2608252 RepID=UPI00123DF72E|nr:amidohydrolase [Nesterenkonia ebinurensis]